MSNHRNPDILLGDKRIPLFDDETRAETPLQGFLWVCPYCAKPWAKLEGKALNTRNFPWRIISWPCLEDTAPADSDILRGGSVLPYMLWFPHDFGFKNKQTLLESISGQLITHEALARSEQILKEYP